MDLDTFNWLLTDEGQALLAEAQSGDLGDVARLQTLTHLRRRATPEQAAAAYEIARLRRRASAKFSRAQELYFTREALEQASGEIIASYRAERYRQFSRIADLCCGCGGDTLALANLAHVVAVDRDPLRLAMAAANTRAVGFTQSVSFAQVDLMELAPPKADAVFFDPARRSGGKRVFSLDAYQPPVSLIHSWREHTPAIGVKVAPGVADEEVANLGELEVEFISLDGELKEAVLWFGSFAEPGRRATVLTNDERRNSPMSQHFASRSISMFRASSSPHPSPPLSEPLNYLYEPDPAIIRAHVVTTLAAQLGAAQLDRSIAYVTSDRFVATPFARCWRIIGWMRFSLKQLRARLRAFDAGNVTVKKRGSPLDTDALARRLSGAGQRSLVVVLTQMQGKPVAIVCEGPLDSRSGVAI